MYMAWFFLFYRTLDILRLAYRRVLIFVSTYDYFSTFYPKTKKCFTPIVTAERKAFSIRRFHHTSTRCDLFDNHIFYRIRTLDQALTFSMLSYFSEIAKWAVVLRKCSLLIELPNGLITHQLNARNQLNPYYPNQIYSLLRI